MPLIPPAACVCCRHPHAMTRHLTPPLTGAAILIEDVQTLPTSDMWALRTSDMRRHSLPRSCGDTPYFRRTLPTSWPLFWSCLLVIIKRSILLDITSHYHLMIDFDRASPRSGPTSQTQDGRTPLHIHSARGLRVLPPSARHDAASHNTYCMLDFDILLRHVFHNAGRLPCPKSWIRLKWN